MPTGSQKGIFLINAQFGGAQPAVGSAMPGWAVLRLIRKKISEPWRTNSTTEQHSSMASDSEPAASSCPDFAQ